MSRDRTINGTQLNHYTAAAVEFRFIVIGLMSNEHAPCRQCATRAFLALNGQTAKTVKCQNDKALTVIFVQHRFITGNCVSEDSKRYGTQRQSKAFLHLG